MYPNIVFTCTTFNRMDLFIKTIDSFLSTCKDKDLISRWLIGDDGSSEQDLQNIASLYPFVEIFRNPKKGQAANLNNLWSKVDTEWFFHCEDDWLFTRKDNYIRKLFDIIEKENNVRNATLRHWEGKTKLCRSKEAREKFEYVIHHYDPDASLEESFCTDCYWCGYTLNPGLQHKPTINLLGKYDESINISSRKWDRPQAQKYYSLGLQRASLKGHYIEHLGEYKSAYELKRLT